MFEGSGLNSDYYESDEKRWNEIDKVRNKVVEHLQIPEGSRVLDVLVGEGDFTRAVAKSSKGIFVVAGEILGSDLKEAKRRSERDKLKDVTEFLRMDVTSMAFIDDSFDYVVNFIGWEDFAAVSGEEFINNVFGEMVRVLRKGGALAITFIPSLESMGEISKKDDELLEYMYKSRKRPKYYREEFFLRKFEKYGIKLVSRNVFETSESRLRPADARKFIEWSCKNYRNFYASDVEMRPYKEILREFGEFIEKHGIRERRSKFILLIGKKS
jgi:ubiquinone/menaquinone biosynthesis C-methylase UbiE